MSAPDPKDWAPTATNLVQLGILLHPPYSTVEYKAAREIIERIARRRALAELKALAKLECSCCRSAEDLRPGGFHYDCEGKYLALCDAEHIHDRIAEIEAEG